MTMKELLSHPWFSNLNETELLKGEEEVVDFKFFITNADEI